MKSRESPISTPYYCYSVRGFAPLDLCYNLAQHRHTYLSIQPFLVCAITPRRVHNSPDCALFRPFESPSNQKNNTQLCLCVIFLVEIRGFEPLAYALRTHRSTNWAIPPRIFCSYCSTFFKNVNTFCRMIKSLFKTDFQKPAFCLTKRKNVCKLYVENVSVAQ